MTAQNILVCLVDFSRGGSERIAIRMAADWVNAGREVTILCGNEGGGLRDTVDPRVRVVEVEPPVARGFLSRFRLARAMARLVDRLQPQVIFLPGNYHLFLALGLRRAQARFALTMKISNPLLPGALANPLGRLLFRHFARAIDGFAALTADFAREVAELAPGKAVALLHDPIYLRSRPGEPSARDDTCHVLWAGRLEPQKDIGLALQTMSAMGARAHLTILGDGGLRADTDARIARLGLSQRVTRIGHVPDIDPYLARADVLLMTSHYEGQPAVVGEALAYGVPVVSTDCCSMLREVMTIPEAGRIVAARDPLALAAALSEVFAAPRPPSQALAALVARFEPRACARAYLDWFDSLVDRI